MAITLTGTRITVEFEAGDPKGDSWNDPYTLDDVVTDIANVTKQGNQIYIPYSLYIEGADTYFLAEDMQVCFDGEVDDTYILYILNAAYFKSQKMAWITLDSKRVWLGGKVDVEDTVFFDFAVVLGAGRSDHSLTLKNISFYGVNVIQIPYTDYIIAENITVIDGVLKPVIDFESAGRILIKNHDSAFQLYAINITINNLMIDNVTTHFLIWPRFSATRIMNCIDSQVDLSLRTVYSNWDGEQIVNNKSTFKINIENGDGGTAKLYDQNDNLIWSEDLSGELEKIVTFQNLDAITLGEEVTKNEVTTYEPFKLVISKDYYNDLIIPNIVIEPGEKTIITGKIVQTKYYQYGITGEVKKQELVGVIEE
jgi:hypothetical protein